jgi:hypothetical protein
MLIFFGENENEIAFVIVLNGILDSPSFSKLNNLIIYGDAGRSHTLAWGAAPPPQAKGLSKKKIN